MPLRAHRAVERKPRWTTGHTLFELLIAVMLVGILAGLAAPAMGGVVRRLRMQAALDVVTRDLFYARMLAIRSGRRVEMHFSQMAAPCVDEYRIVVLDEPPREAKRVRVQDFAGGLCLRKNGPAVIAISSRGRPGWNLSFWLRHDALVDSLTLNQLGRVHRWR